jgi:hypothetical protein
MIRYCPRYSPLFFRNYCQNGLNLDDATTVVIINEVVPSLEPMEYGTRFYDRYGWRMLLLTEFAVYDKLMTAKLLFGDNVRLLWDTSRESFGFLITDEQHADEDIQLGFDHLFESKKEYLLHNLELLRLFTRVRKLVRFGFIGVPSKKRKF